MTKLSDDLSRRKPSSALALIRASEPKPRAPRKRSLNPDTKDFRNTVRKIASYVWFDCEWSSRDRDGLDRARLAQVVARHGGQPEHVDAVIAAALDEGRKDIIHHERDLEAARAAVKALEAMIASNSEGRNP